MRLLRHFDNKTQWSTRQLKALCLAVIKHEGSGNHWLRISYKTRRYSQYHGRATINGTSVEMFVPRLTKTTKKAKYIMGDDGKQKWAGEFKQVGNWKRWVGGWEYSTKNVVFEPQQFARVLTHEIHHNLGKQHDDMVAVSALNCDYAAGFIVEPQQSPPKVSKEDRVQERATPPPLMKCLYTWGWVQSTSW